MVYIGIKHDPIFFWTLSALCFYAFVISYPINKFDQNNKPDMKNEIRLPNGTIIGKYNYLDKEGNPINVKYYADNTSYGVELNSIKIVGDPKLAISKINKLYDITNETQPKLMSNLFNTNNDIKSANENLLEHFNKDTDKMNHAKFDKTNSDYDVYYQKELKDGPNNCNNNKIKIYYDKEKRIIRNAIYNYGVSQYCDQF